MREIDAFLEKVKAQPALFLGKKDLKALSYSLCGYESAIFDLTGRRVLWNTKFQRFVEGKYGDEYIGTIHWSNFLLKRQTEEEAFDLFFDLWTEFSQRYPDWEELDFSMI